MAAVPPPYARWRAKRVWLRDPARALRLLDGVPARTLDGESLAVRAWLALTFERDTARAERAARAALERGGDTRLASAALTELLLRRGEHDAALDVLRAARERLPGVPWYDLSAADALIEVGRVAEAEELLERAVSHPRLRRHALKRLARLALTRGDRARARRWFEELLALAPDYLVYASDYVALAELRLEAGEVEAARATARAGAEIYPRNAALARLRAERFGEDQPLSKPNVPAVSETHVGARRIPVRTPLITARTGLLEVVDPATAPLRQPGDVIAVGESPAAAGQARIVPLELVKPGPLARLLCRFVGKHGPLHSPEGMQGAIMEAGRPRIAAAAIAGALGKLAGRRGWFYRVAGPGATMIDDVAAAMPPHDHHVVFGPRAPDALATQLARALDCPVAIVDANHLNGAWVVGASPGVDAAWVEAALADNPAGNEDEGTPVVILRPLGTERRYPSTARAASSTCSTWRS
jgi:tetratricopeptide (TPR) repeat protein